MKFLTFAIGSAILVSTLANPQENWHQINSKESNSGHDST